MRVSSTVLGARGGEIPSRDSLNESKTEAAPDLGIADPSESGIAHPCGTAWC